MISMPTAGYSSRVHTVCLLSTFPSIIPFVFDHYNIFLLVVLFDICLVQCGMYSTVCYIVKTLISVCVCLCMENTVRGGEC